MVSVGLRMGIISMKRAKKWFIFFLLAQVSWAQDSLYFVQQDREGPSLKLTLEETTLVLSRCVDNQCQPFRAYHAQELRREETLSPTAKRTAGIVTAAGSLISSAVLMGVEETNQSCSKRARC